MLVDKKIKELHNNMFPLSCVLKKLQQIDLLHVNVIKGTEPNFIAHRKYYISILNFFFMYACPVVVSNIIFYACLNEYLLNFRIGVGKLVYFGKCG